MAYQQYPGGYGGPGGPPPQGQYGYQPPQGFQNGPPPPVPPHPNSFQPLQHQGTYHQPGGSANSYYDSNSAPPPGQYGSNYTQPPPYGFPPQPGYNDSRATPFNGPPQPPGQYPPSQYPPGPSNYSSGPYGGPPPNQYQPQQPYGNYNGQPSGSYGGPPGPLQGQFNGQYPPPNQQQFPGQYPPGFAGPSPGYEEPPQCNPLEYSKQADQLRKAMKGLGTDEDALIRVLAQMQTPYAIHSVQRAFSQRFGRELLTDLKKETSGHFREALLAVARGPLLEEVHALHDAIHRPGTTESVLNDVLLCRSPPDLDAIKKAYKRTFARDLESDVRGDLSMKTENMFAFVLENRRAPENAPIDPGQSKKDAYNIQMALDSSGATGTGGVFGGTHQEAVYSTILSRNDAQIGALAYEYECISNRRLDVMIEKKFSGHMQQALLYAVNGGTNKAQRDARLLEDAMKGLGTKDSLLIHRLVKYRWNKAHFENVKRAYKETYHRSLEDRVHGETSGDYRKFLVALLI